MYYVLMNCRTVNRNNQKVVIPRCNFN